MDDLARGQSAETPPFYIAASASSAHRRPYILKEGEVIGIFDDYGNVQAVGPATEGVFFEDTRYLSHFFFTIDSRLPLLLSSSVNRNDSAFESDQTNPDLMEGGRIWLARNSIHIHSTMVLGRNTLFAIQELTNFGVTSTRFDYALRFAADFKDMFELRGIARARRGEDLPPEASRDGGVLAYRGLDGRLRRACFGFAPAADEAAGGSALWHVDLAPGERRTLRVELRCELEGRSASRASLEETMAIAARHAAERREQTARLSTSNVLADEWLTRSRADLEMLNTETPHGLYPYAGIPWFSTAFGRDGLITAFECLWLDPTMAAGTLRFLAAHQATTVDARSDAEPGKILHETRKGEMAALGEVPFGLYYGSVDATPLFVMLAAAYYARTGDIALIRALWPHIEAALAWMTDYGDLDGDGFLEYGRQSENGLDNQGWKDSSDAIFHEDGSLAQSPIALVEVQAYAYGAYLGAARLAAALGHGERATELEKRASLLRQHFEKEFWSDELGTYVLALDRDKRHCRVRASNAGHVLFGGLAAPNRAARTAETLMAPGFFSGWGIRTLAEGEARYNPVSYHNGSVWPHDNGVIAMGFAKYGLKSELLRIMTSLFDAALLMPLKRLPELFCGFTRREERGPTSYPVACSPQAWSSAAAFGLLGAALGVSFDAEARRIQFDRPMLPPWLPELTLSNLRLGGATVDLHLRRSAEDVVLHLARREGQVEVLQTD
jgi:glycogen debranching enzyme